VALEAEGGYTIYLLRDNGLRFFESFDLVLQNGWTEASVVVVKSRDIAGYPYLGNIREVDPKRFGPVNTASR
jgi:hypothetical protein